MFGTGIFFTEDYSNARSYAFSDECVLSVKLIGNITDSRKCQGELVDILETFEKLKNHPFFRGINWRSV